MMTLYSSTVDSQSHRCRIVLYEKDMDFNVVDIDVNNINEDHAILNTRGQWPMLIERDLTLYEANIINEYIDERFPHPQLMPVDPMMRGRVRLLLHDMEAEFFSHLGILESGISENTMRANSARKTLRNNLIRLRPILEKYPYLMGEEYSMLDVAMTPLLWRLNYYDIKLPNEASIILKYAERLFSRPLYSASMTPSEKAMRK